MNETKIWVRYVDSSWYNTESFWEAVKGKPVPQNSFFLKKTKKPVVKKAREKAKEVKPSQLLIENKKGELIQRNRYG